MTSRSASAESNADQATMSARSVKQAAQIAVTHPTSRSFLRRPRDSIGNLRATRHVSATSAMPAHTLRHTCPPLRWALAHIAEPSIAAASACLGCWCPVRTPLCRTGTNAARHWWVCLYCKVSCGWRRILVRAVSLVKGRLGTP